MADTNEAQLLSDLLRAIAQTDAGLDAPHLESRVIDAASPAGAEQRGLRAAGLMRWAIAAAVATAVLAPAVLWQNPETGVPDTIHRDTERQANAEREVTAVSPHQALSNPLDDQARPVRGHDRNAPSHEDSASARAESSDEFIPLMPMTDQELSGPFQIVRVQMPRASLGALRSPLEFPNELVEADVLLGQDGMARAIRVSASGSVYPWRPR